MSLEFKSKVVITVTRLDGNENNKENRNPNIMVINTHGLPHIVLAQKTSEPFDRTESLEVKAVGSSAEGIIYWITKTDHIGESQIATQFVFKLNNKSEEENKARSDAALREMLLDKAFTALIQPMNNNPFYRNKFNHNVAQWMIDNALVKVGKDIRISGIEPGLNSVSTFQQPIIYNNLGLDVERFYKVDKGILTIDKTVTKRTLDRFTRETKHVPGPDHHESNCDVYAGVGYSYNNGGVGYNQQQMLPQGIPLMTGRGFNNQPLMNTGGYIPPMQHGIPTQPLYGNGGMQTQTGHAIYGDNKTIAKNKIQYWVDELRRVMSTAVLSEEDGSIEGFFDNVSAAFLDDNFISTIITTPSDELSNLMKCELISVYLRSPGFAMIEGTRQQAEFNSSLQREFNAPGYRSGDMMSQQPGGVVFNQPMGYAVGGLAPAGVAKPQIDF